MSDVPTYQIDQKIVYPSQGVGKITDITTKKFKDQELNYYVIYLEVSDMTVMVPVNKAEELGADKIEFIDEYRGNQVPKDKKSITLKVGAKKTIKVKGKV